MIWLKSHHFTKYKAYCSGMDIKGHPSVGITLQCDADAPLYFALELYAVRIVVMVYKKEVNDDELLTDAGAVSQG